MGRQAFTPVILLPSLQTQAPGGAQTEGPSVCPGGSRGPLLTSDSSVRLCPPGAGRPWAPDGTLEWHQVTAGGAEVLCVIGKGGQG